MTTKNLLNKEDVEIGGKTFFISSIPAIPAQKIWLRAMGSLRNGDFSAIPNDMLMEILSYAGTYNDSHAEIQFVNEEIIGMAIQDPMVLLELEAKMIKKNFSFFLDGRISKVLEEITGAIPASAS